jgi:threonine/homoserine/homoserine lactone efflux protein
MLAWPILFKAACAAGIVTLTPGPGLLAFLTLGASQGRRDGAYFLAGHLAGDISWAIAALITLVGAQLVAPWVFDILALFCGCYLLYLGLRALLARRSPEGQQRRIERPLLRGLTFGLSNPKSYPVTLAVFAGLLANAIGGLTLAETPVLLLACLAGFLTADVILAYVVGLAGVQTFYRRYQAIIVRLTGLMFIAFAVNALLLFARSVMAG